MSDKSFESLSLLKSPQLLSVLQRIRRTTPLWLAQHLGGRRGYVYGLVKRCLFLTGSDNECSFLQSSTGCDERFQVTDAKLRIFCCVHLSRPIHRGGVGCGSMEGGGHMTQPPRSWMPDVAQQLS